MAEQSREYLKTRFESGDQPSQQDFADLIDSMTITSDDFVFDRNGNLLCDHLGVALRIG